ncbi:MAG: DUF3127 domain-containing protein, partial [Bacteroidales bacterium]|nr:DUF3127 domain-containing protein [Bacteroidales bacterium]
MQSKTMNKTFKVVKLLPLQSGTSERGDWRSQDVLIESMEQREQSQAR